MQDGRHGYLTLKGDVSPLSGMQKAAALGCEWRQAGALGESGNMRSSSFKSSTIIYCSPRHRSNQTCDGELGRASQEQLKAKAWSTAVGTEHDEQSQAGGMLRDPGRSEYRTLRFERYVLWAQPFDSCGPSR